MRIANRYLPMKYVPYQQLVPCGLTECLQLLLLIDVGNLNFLNKMNGSFPKSFVLNRIGLSLVTYQHFSSNLSTVDPVPSLP